MYEVDHIDPRWVEGRDYQMVCGWDNPLNYCERDTFLNISKNNRFLPWRVASDGIGTVPINQGDLCLFLVGADIKQDIPGEWVLMEFLSEEWFAATKKTGGNSQNRTVTEKVLNQWEHCRQKQREWLKNNPQDFIEKVAKKAWAATEEMRRNGMLGSLGGVAAVEKRKNDPKAFEVHSNRSRRVASIKYQCTVTGYISTACGLANWQRKRGIDTSNRVRYTETLEEGLLCAE